MFQRRSAALLSLTVVPVLTAQSNPALAKVADIGGVVTEAASLRPAEKVWVCAYPLPRESSSPQPCVRTDSAGSYQVHRIPFGTFRVAVVCETLRGLGKEVASDTIVIAEAGSLKKNWGVQTSGCDPRPIRRLSGVFRGHFTAGFEESSFVPCPQDAWFLPGDSLDIYPYDARRAWADVPKGAGLNWPQKVERTKWGSSRVYVQWRGTVTGPGSYGHMGGSVFEFRVDSVLNIRGPGTDDCR